jgi:glyceraldehyde 3-phosphate dehydrogenase
VHIFGINGFGRIGRTAARVWWRRYRHQAELRSINTSGSMSLAEWAHLLKYDSNYGVFPEKIKIEEHQPREKLTDENPILGLLVIGRHEILVTGQKDPAKLLWGQLGVETVIDSTGVFTSQEKAELHLQAGAKKVVLSAPTKDDTPTIVLGVNKPTKGTTIVSNASCTTNCITPVMAVLQKEFGVLKSMMTTVHSYTDDQNLHDNSHKDLRRARAAAENIVPTTTGAAISTTKVIPKLAGHFDGLSLRVPTPVGSISDMTCVLKKKTSVEAVNQAFIKAAKLPQWRGILAVTSEPLVSSDIIGRPESAIIDLSLTQVVDGDLVKVVAWYDNEWGYCTRLIEVVKDW